MTSIILIQNIIYVPRGLASAIIIASKYHLCQNYWRRAR
jgi:hypothetical protein